MHHLEKWLNILSTICDTNTARLLKYVWAIINIKRERVTVELEN